MRRILLALASCALGLGVTTGTASAHEHHGRPPAVRYYHNHGVPFRGGYYYRGYDHPHWADRVWDNHYCRWNYRDPYLNCFYYWYAPAGCYYPVTYCP